MSRTRQLWRRCTLLRTSRQSTIPSASLAPCSFMRLITYKQRCWFSPGLMDGGTFKPSVDLSGFCQSLLSRPERSEMSDAFNVSHASASHQNPVVQFLDVTI